MGILPDRGWKPCPRNGRQILNPWATREFLFVFNTWLSMVLATQTIDANVSREGADLEFE